MNNAHLSTSVRELFEKHKIPMLLMDPNGCHILFANRRARVMMPDIMGEGLTPLAKEKKKLTRHLQKALAQHYHHFKLETDLPLLPLARVDASVIMLEEKKHLLLIFSDISKIPKSKKAYKNKRELYGELNTMLAKRIENEVSLRYSQDELFLQHSKMAALGEMMDTIAHQWKQPLNSLNFYAGMLRDNPNDSPLTQEEIDEISHHMERQIEHLNTTLNEFRNFYRHDREKRHFFIKPAVKSVLALMKGELLKHKIEPQEKFSSDFPLLGYENEFKHIVINLINNAKEAFAINGIENRQLFIRTGEDEKEHFLSIEDNAGGIPPEFIGKIFQRNFTTKKEQGGSGVGLHLASIIAEKHGMQLRAENCQNGTAFLLSISKHIVQKPAG